MALRAAVSSWEKIFRFQVAERILSPPSTVRLASTRSPALRWMLRATFAGMRRARPLPHFAICSFTMFPVCRALRVAGAHYTVVNGGQAPALIPMTDALKKLVKMVEIAVKS